MAIGLLRACGNATHDRVVNSVLYSAAGEIGNARVTTFECKRILSLPAKMKGRRHNDPMSSRFSLSMVSRRKFLKSLSRSALVLPLADVFALAVPQAQGEAQATKPPDLGVHFENIA